jgi:hypothetical protein
MKLKLIDPKDHPMQSHHPAVDAAAGGVFALASYKLSLLGPGVDLASIAALLGAVAMFLQAVAKVLPSVIGFLQFLSTELRKPVTDPVPVPGPPAPPAPEPVPTPAPAPAPSAVVIPDLLPPKRDG